MKIDTLKDLKALVKLCRQTGIEAIKVDGLEIALGPTPTIIKRSKAPRASQYIQDGEVGPIDTPDTLTDEQMLFWSAEGGQQ